MPSMVSCLVIIYLLNVTLTSLTLHVHVAEIFVECLLVESLAHHFNGISNSTWLCCVYRVWDANKLETIATTEVKSSLLSLDWAPNSDHLVLMGSGDGVVKMFDGYQAKTLWEVYSETKFPK